MALAGCLGGGGDSSGVSVPGIYDMSGATSDVGRPAGIGSRDAIKWINNNDELDSEINHDWQDYYSYDVPQAKSAYDEYTSGSNPPAIIGWGRPIPRRWLHRSRETGSRTSRRRTRRNW